jgi:xylan 1,4-beta-xylosidase
MSAPPKLFFNAHHSPIGAFATFTLGQAGAAGGFGLEIGKPADHDIFIGIEEAASSGSSEFRMLPFYEDGGPRSSASSESTERSRYEVGGGSHSGKPRDYARLRPYGAAEIRRDFRVATDTWTAGDLTVSVISPVLPIPDPEDGESLELKLAIVPAILVQLTVDNRTGTRPKRAVFGYGGSGGHDVSAMRRLDDTACGRLAGVGHGRTVALAGKDTGIVSAQGFTIVDILSEKIPENLTFALGDTAALIAETPAGERRSFQIAVCFYRGGLATCGIDTTYFYTRFWDDIEGVAKFALDNFDVLAASARRADAWIDKAPLSADQRFMLAHAVRSYYGNTQLLQHGASGKPIWIVNEGEYRMMNTLDLTVDQIYYEMAMSPWAVRNELELFEERYSYTDHVRLPDKSEKLYDGGISFTHDMGVANVFSRPSYSSYEKHGLTGCFSHMTHEELVNWLCCALIYGHRDKVWLKKRLSTIVSCFASMLNRDHPDPALRDGVMSLDSDRCRGGAEITTYDSLDASLGQSRGNVYLAGKCWAVYVGLEGLFRENGKIALADQALDQARKCARTVCDSRIADGTIPALIGEDVQARIIPAIEGLIYPEFFGRPNATKLGGEFSEYVDLLRSHLNNVLVEGVCLFPGGAWKLSSTSDNSWLSKIYLCQYVARRILGVDGDAVTTAPDAAHVGWLVDSCNAYWCWSDQMVAGVAEGSRYYPRGVTAWLWLHEKCYAPTP